MTRLFLIMVLGLSVFTSFGQKSKEKILTPNYKCRDNWQYFSLHDTLTGQVIFHAKAIVLCGVLATASLTIIKTGSDTIRVLELCNSNKDFKKSRFVKVKPEERPSFGVILPVDNKYYDCNIRKTCYGKVQSL
jgi:hypothetical protein